MKMRRGFNLLFKMKKNSMSIFSQSERFKKKCFLGKKGYVSNCLFYIHFLYQSSVGNAVMTVCSA